MNRDWYSTYITVHYVKHLDLKYCNREYFKRTHFDTCGTDTTKPTCLEDYKFTRLTGKLQTCKIFLNPSPPLNIFFSAFRHIFAEQISRPEC
jgi:hypothetical protein